MLWHIIKIILNMLMLHHIFLILLITVDVEVECDFCCTTGLPGIPKQNYFPDHRIQKWGCVFLCTCVKGGLTTFGQCMICFQWGMTTGKLRSNDCYVNDKEQWAREISSRYGTPYHSDYIFQRNSQHYWLIQNGKEIYNSKGIGWRQ